MSHNILLLLGIANGVLISSLFWRYRCSRLECRLKEVMRNLEDIVDEDESKP